MNEFRIVEEIKKHYKGKLTFTELISDVQILIDKHEISIVSLHEMCAILTWMDKQMGDIFKNGVKNNEI